MDERKNYVFVLPWAPHYPGGVNQVVLNLAKEIDSHGEFKPLVLTSTWRRGPGEARSSNSTIELRQPIYPHKPLISVLGFILRMPWWMVRLWKSLRRLDAAVINFHYPTLAAWPVVMLRSWGLFRFKLVLSFHGTDIANARKDPWYCSRLWRSMINRCDHVVVCSESLAADLRSLVPVMNKVPMVIHNGVAEVACTPAQEDTSGSKIRDELGCFVLCVATYDRKKGIDVLLSAFAMIDDRFSHVSLVLIGREGSEHAPLQKLIAELRLEDRVRCLINVEHAKVMHYHRAAAIFALASRDEALGIAILEAGLMGVPVIASRVGGIPEIISSPELGILVEPEDVGMLAQAIENLLASDAKRHEMGQRLRAHVTANFTWQAAGCKYLRLIGSLAGENDRSGSNDGI